MKKLSVQELIDRLRDYDCVRLDCCFKPHGTAVIVEIGDGEEAGPQNVARYYGDSVSEALEKALQGTE